FRFQKVTILPLVEYKRFTKYLKEGSLTLCRKLESLLNAKAKEDFVTSLISVLQYNKKAVSFLNQLIISDVKQAGDNDKVLFRANSMATKAIEVYMRLVGERYLETTLQEPVSRIIKSTKDFEVDCTKLQGDSSPSLEERRSNLLEAVRLVWSSILKSPKYFPAEIQEVFFAVRETLRNNDSFNRLISASVFLRLLCPA
ncbi:putative Ras GTPase-activating protein, partial [Armadillidium nasatum]